VATPTSSRPGRALLVLVIILLSLTGFVVWQGATSLRLGLDLQGGTSVTLQPRAEGGNATAETIDQAVEIIRQRVNSLGVAESEVSAQGTGGNRQIVISVPGETGRRIVDLVGQTAELRFRQVLVEAGGVPAPEGSPTDGALPPGVTAEQKQQFDQLDCTLPESTQGGGGDTADQVMIACDRSGGTKYILAPADVLGRQVSDASAAIDQTGAGGWYVELNFNREGTRAFADVTRRVVNLTPPQNQVAIVLDGLVVSAPRIIEAIPSGTAQITGSFSRTEAQDLSNVLKYGALPLAFDRGEVQQISATLGADQLRGGLLAGGLGLILVFIFSVLYYRALGLVTVGSLLIAGSLTYLIFLALGAAIGFTLTLAGIAGAIVAIGVTADSFIVFFERLRDEVREGKSLRSAIEAGWVRARRTILVSDFVSIIAAVLLYIFAAGSVKGFAFALGVTTFIDLIVIFLFTKPLMTLMARTAFFGQGRRFSGFDTARMGTTLPAKKNQRLAQSSLQGSHSGAADSQEA
jgi:preprotein translocase subunit SecD